MIYWFALIYVIGAMDLYIAQENGAIEYNFEWDEPVRVAFVIFWPVFALSSILEHFGILDGF